MTLNDNAINILTHLKASQIVGVKQQASDMSFYIRSLARLISQNHAGIPCFLFSQAQGLQKIAVYQDGEQMESSEVLPRPKGADPLLHYLDAYLKFDGDGIFIFLDLHEYLTPPNSDRAILSYLRAISTSVEQSDNLKRIVLLGQELQLPIELVRLIPIIENGLPCSAKRRAALTHKFRELFPQQNYDLEVLIEATSGLTVREIYDQFMRHYHLCVYRGEDLEETALTDRYVTYKTSLLKALNIDVSQPRNLEFGGHGDLKLWLQGVKAILAPDARNYGIPFPKGCLLGGVSGVGKTLIAESISNSWHLPLIKLSIPALKGSLVGESESNLKRALELIESIKGVVLIDEVEKAVAGAGTDSSGVTGGMLSILLDYMNNQTQHFVICTANKVTDIPAELMRKGRLDEIWFVGLPDTEERAEILAIHFFQQQRVVPDYVNEVRDFIPSLAERTIDFSGAELAALVTKGLTNIYLAGRAAKPTSADFIPLASSIIPLAKAQPQQYQEVLDWSKKARSTSSKHENHQNSMLAVD